ncbi:MAG: phosphatidate cytidylyltransferase [Magnetococcales bacterium]|nr:phosphatidate cytidylyltransferase [Magnetococcales bacterium]NGZ25683.1 phosphatidate cytidylyltransferase [Magnetococcales bacterium]
MLLRTLSALVLAPLVLLLLLRGEVLHLFVVFMVLIVGLLREWVRLRPAPFRFHLPLMILGGWLLLTTQYYGNLKLVVALLALVLAFMLGIGVFRYQAGRAESDWISFSLLGLVYCVLPLLLLMEIRVQEHGAWWLCYLTLVIWATDTGAYLVGKAIGSRKLIPRLSPGKTWEGLLGGLTLGAMAGLATLYGAGIWIGLYEGIAFSFALAVVSQLGDLAESLMKREADIKDSGQLIPGHGGLMDRLDSLLYSAPLLAIYLFGMGLGGH